MRRRIDFLIILALDLLIVTGVAVYLAAPHARIRGLPIRPPAFAGVRSLS